MNDLHQSVDVLPYLFARHIPVSIRDGYAEHQGLLIPFSPQENAVFSRINIPGILAAHERTMVDQCLQNCIDLGVVDIIVSMGAAISLWCSACAGTFIS
jgi:hypothetical protein